MSTQQWSLDADQILALPLDDLALRILQNAKATNEWNWRNWLLGERTRHNARKDVLKALSEAWAWLINRGLIVSDINQSAFQAFVISRRGEELLEKGLSWIRAVERLDLELVPELEAKARPQFLRGDFETAAFVSMKEVEVKVRDLGGFPNGAIGTALMQQAFRPPKNQQDDDGGPLFSSDLEPAESVATMNLFAGAIGLFKNPASHRRVDLDDPTEAAEVVLLADLLMRLLNKIETSRPTPEA